MENATKALLLAAEILIGLMILSLAVYLFGTFRNYITDSQKRVDETTIAAYNGKFQDFANRDDITIQEIVSLKNYVVSYNESYYSGSEKDFVTALKNGSITVNSIDGSNDYANIKIIDNVDPIRGKDTILTISSAEIMNIYLSDSRISETYTISNGSNLAGKPKYGFKCTKIELSDVTGKVYNIEFKLQQISYN